MMPFLLNIPVNVRFFPTALIYSYVKTALTKVYILEM